MNKPLKFTFRFHLTYRLLAITIAVLVVLSCQQKESPSPPFGMVVHGGAGTILKKNMTSELEEAYSTKLTEALSYGYNILNNGGSSLDAVETAIKILEDSPLFNAGKGAVFTHSGTNEFDASIMDGKTLMAGAVGAVKHVKNPIALARLVMEKTPHVMLTGEGAEAFAKEQGVELMPDDYFFTERRWKQLQRKIERGKKNTNPSKDKTTTIKGLEFESSSMGTVGAVALDKAGNLAAATSTGGLTNKRFGRVGDSPIIGAGTYANNRTCAVSGTGQGEYFMRSLVGYDISVLMEYRGMSLEKAANTVVMKKLVKLGGSGGVIAIDKDGNVAMPFNTEGMYRGYVDRDGKVIVKIYRE
ncbi:MAG: isoaspartyl peptidase/L-asparaginase [Candidatus Marinimicrobia bacterium]|nr:isoaspartyl peptidase/L-asparaginase [Candidatus Neomarinimicrobiota bacterium]